MLYAQLSSLGVWVFGYDVNTSVYSHSVPIKFLHGSWLFRTIKAKDASKQERTTAIEKMMRTHHFIAFQTKRTKT
jgi:hypothetical protein